MSSHEAHEQRHKAHILMSKRGKKMSFLEIQMALQQFDFINKRRGAPRAVRRQNRALNDKLLSKRKVPYNSSNDADDEDFDSDSHADSDFNPEAGMDDKIDVTKNLAREFRDNPVFDPYEPYLSTCSSMESLTASDRERSVKRMRIVRKMHKRRRRCNNHIFFMGMLNEPMNTPHDADDEDDSPSNIDSNYSSGFDENEYITSSEDSEDDEEDFVMNEAVKRKIDEARAMFAKEDSSQSSDEQSNHAFCDMPKRQRLMVSEDDLTDGNSS